MKNLSTFICLFFITLSCYAQDRNQPVMFGGINPLNPAQHTGEQATPRMDCDTTFSFPTRGLTSGLASDGENLWYVDTDFMYRTTMDGTHVDSFPNPADFIILFRGGGLTHDGENLWYCDEQSSVLFKMNPITGAVLSQYPLPAAYLMDPNIVGVAWDGNHIWLSQYDPNKLYKFDPVSEIITDSINLSSTVGTMEWIEGILYGQNLGFTDPRLYVVNTDTGSLEDSIDWCVPFALGITLEGSTIWSLSGPDTLIVQPTDGNDRIYGLETSLISSVENKTADTGISVFPNPATNDITIQGENIKKIEVYNLTGALVFQNNQLEQQENITVDSSLIGQGIYFAVIHRGEKKYTRKIIIQK